ncbi:STAS domain-containing protein [Nonomuraea fuscirosea]|uniref:STAS domain-containing protein n=1 Tax=Nonomuraea fuscirosea TaxID=1291556 RepID=UPI00343E39AB
MGHAPPVRRIRHHPAERVIPGTAAHEASHDAKELIVDLSTVAFCDSSGLSALVYALRRCRNTSTHLILTGVRGTQERWMTVTGLPRIFDRRPRVTDALPAAAG